MRLGWVIRLPQSRGIDCIRVDVMSAVYADDTGIMSECGEELQIILNVERKETR